MSRASHACERKKHYNTREAAEHAAVHYFRRFGQLGRPYECEHCGKWHLTCSTRYQRGRRGRARAVE